MDLPRAIVRPRAAWAVLLASLAVVLGVGVLTPAAAHARLVSTDPGEGAVLPRAPHELRLVFNEPVRVVGDGLRAFGPEGAEHRLEGHVRDATAVVTLPELGQGTWAVAWRVVSEDGHPIAGTLTFSIGAPSATPPHVATPRAHASLEGLRTALQATAYVATLVVAGLLVFRGYVAPGAFAPAGLRRSLLALAVLASTAALGLVPVTGAMARGQGVSTLGDPDSWTTTGTADAWLSLLVLTAGLLAALGLRRTAPRLAAVLGCAAPAAYALTGHSRGVEPLALVLASDVAHAVAGAVWLGGLVGLAVVLHRAALSRDELLTVVTRFSTAAAASLLGVAVTGLVLGWRIVGAWSALWQTDHGRLLLVKLALVAAVVVLGAWNRWRLLPRLSSAGTARLRRSVAAEAGVLAGALVVTAALVGRAPSPPADAATRGPAVAHAVVGEHHVAMTLSPGRVGVNRLVLEVVDGRGRPAALTAVPRVELRLGDLDLGSLAPSAAGPGRFTHRVVLPRAGRWHVRASLPLSRYASPVGVLVVDVRE